MTVPARLCCHSDPSGQHAAGCSYWALSVRLPDEQTANARRHLRSAIALLTDAEGRISEILTTLATIAADGYPGGSTGPHAGISDPTGATVVARDRYAELWDTITGLAVEVHGHANQLIAAIQYVPTTNDTAGTARQHRCTGAPNEPWGDPTCTNLAVRGDLCWKCIKREQRYAEQEIA